MLAMGRHKDGEGKKSKAVWKLRNIIVMKDLVIMQGCSEIDNKGFVAANVIHRLCCPCRRHTDEL